MNAGFVEVRDLESGNLAGPFDCVIFHDIDMLPEDDRNFYGCGDRHPRHVGSYINKFKYECVHCRDLLEISFLVHHLSGIQLRII